MLADRYTFLNWHCLPEPPGVALGLIPVPWDGGLTVSTVSLSSARHSGDPLAFCSGTPSIRRSEDPLACCSGTSFACCSGAPVTRCWGTSSPPIDCSSAHVLHGGAFMLSGGATRTSSSFDHSNTVVLHVRVV